MFMRMVESKGILTEDEVKVVLAAETSKSAKIKTLFEHGYEVKEIARLLDIRYNFAYNVIQNHVIVNSIEIDTEKKATRKDEVFVLFDEGKTLTEVSRELKMNYNYVWKLRKEWERLAAKEAEATDDVAK